MTKIWGIGLPRTGTTSLAEALNLLGFNTNHYCKLQKGDAYLSDILDEGLRNDAVVNNHLYKFYHRIYTLEEMDSKIGLYVLSYRLDKYVLDNLEYIKEVYQFFHKKKKLSHLLLLDMNANETDKWTKLSVFLGREAPKNSYPHLNRGSGI